jgi:long-chain acyl-CoA synthetase
MMMCVSSSTFKYYTTTTTTKRKIFFSEIDVIDQVCGTNLNTTTNDNNDTTQDNNPNMTDKTIIDFFLDNVEKLGDRRFMTQPMGGGEANNKYWTFNETLAEAKLMAGYIESLKLPPKSNIAICSKNCAWWVIADLAIWMSGHVSIPIYPTLTAETTKYCLEHSESKLCFVGKLDSDPWKEMKEGVPADLTTISFPLCPDNAAQKTWDQCIKEASPIDTLVKRVPEEMATIIYTSGSTGK